MNTLGEYDVVAVDADSRAVSADVAYRRVAEVARFVERTSSAFFKSMDSTLRGNLGAEVDAVMDIITFDLAVVAPAFPLYGRTTAAGIHFLHGQRIDETEFATDPQSPVKDADLLRVFGAQSRRTAGHVGLELVRKGQAAVCRRATELRRNGVELAIFDAQAEADLDVIVSGLAASDLRVLWVGSTGLAGHVSQTLTPRDPGHVHSQARGEAGAPTLSIVGSASQVTRQQVAEFLRLPGVSSVRMDPLQIIEEGGARDREIGRCLTQALVALGEGRDVVLDVVSGRDDISATKNLGLQMGLDGAQVGRRVVESMAEITYAVVETAPVAGLILTGGDTARAVCDRFAAYGILVLQEVEPGIPLARMIGHRELPIVTKAGGFGDVEALIHASRLLKRER
jgi:uncharacterized protein YgbK (DUF1537 family)